MATMNRALSVPGIIGIGCRVPKDGNHHKKASLLYRVGGHGPIDGMKSFSLPEKARSLADTIAETPDWRSKAFAERERKEEEPAGHKNMRMPRLSPAWLKHDKQVLRFYAFFQETVVERFDENCRYRNVVICFHMEDGTLGVTEPKVENSGIPGGPFLKRQQVPREDGRGFIGPADLRVGESISFNGVTFQITGCDRFTRWFYEENGIPLAEDEPLLQDQWSKSYTFNKVAETGGLPKSRSAVEAKRLACYQLGAPPADLKLVQFLQNDRKVLRFKAYWDDHTLYGNRIYFTVHYFLADNTVEINEAHVRNSGRDRFAVFFKRGKLFKENQVQTYPGFLEPIKEPYLPEDLTVGSSFAAWGRKFVIYDCDEFTQRFYQEYLGIDQSACTLDVAPPPVRHPKLLPPPHNGIGTEEDSLESCLRVQCKAAKKDLARLMTLSGELLRFECRMVNGEAEDENRRFIIGFWPADGTVACWECAVRNSGHVGGRFQEKKRTKNPSTGKWFELPDLAIGKVAIIAAQPLLIMRADEHTLLFLERHAEELNYAYASPEWCANELRPLADSPELQDERGIDPDRLKELAAEHGVNMLDHQIVTLLRNYNVAQDGGVPMISGPRVLETISMLSGEG